MRRGTVNLCSNLIVLLRQVLLVFLLVLRLELRLGVVLGQSVMRPGSVGSRGTDGGNRARRAALGHGERGGSSMRSGSLGGRKRVDLGELGSRRLVDLVGVLGHSSGRSRVLDGVSLSQLGLDGRQEDGKVGVEVLRSHSEVPVEQEQQLLLHEVHLVQGEQVHGVLGPVLVLWRRVVEVLGGHDERGQEDAVGGAGHALGQRRQRRSQSGEVDQRGHQSGGLDVGRGDQVRNELVESGEVGARLGHINGRRRRRRHGGIALDDGLGGGDQVVNHGTRHSLLAEDFEGLLVGHFGRWRCFLCNVGFV